VILGRAVERFGSGADEVSCGRLAGEVEEDRFGRVADVALSVVLDAVSPVVVDACCAAFWVLPLFCESAVGVPVSVAAACGVCDVVVA